MEDIGYLIPQEITHPHKFNIKYFEKYYREFLNNLYRDIIWYLKKKQATIIWSNINYSTFVQYIYQNSIKVKPVKN